MNDCTDSNRFHPGAVVRVPMVVNNGCPRLRLPVVIGIIKKVRGLSVTVDVTWDPVCQRNPQMFVADEITIPAMLLTA